MPMPDMPMKPGMMGDEPGSDVPENETPVDNGEFMICVRCYRDHTFAVSKEPLDVDDNARNGGYEAEGDSGGEKIDNAEEALKEVYGMMKESMNSDAEQAFQQGFGKTQERY